MRIPGDAVLAAGEPMGFAFWRDRVGFASAASLGFRSRVSTKGGTLSLLLTAEAGAAEEPEVETVEEPEPETVEEVEVEVDAEEREADARESLSRKTKAEIALVYAEIVGGGDAPPSKWTKAKIVEEIVAAVA